MIETLALANKNYLEFFPGDWVVFGLAISIAWAIKYGCDYTDNSP